MKNKNTELSNTILRANTISSKNWLQAVNILEKAAEDYPQEAVIYLTLGDIFLRQKQYEQALSSFQKAQLIDPDDEHLKFVIGNCYLSLGEYQMALQKYKEIKIESPELTYNLALVYAYSNQHSESLEQLNKLIETIPENLNLHYFIVEELLRLHKYDEALEWLNKLERQFGIQRYQQILMGFIWTFKKIWLKAFTSFKNADDMYPITNPDHMQSYATACREIGQLDKAIEILKKAIRVNPFVSLLSEELIRIYLHKKDFTAAESVITEAFKNLGKSNPILLLLKEKLDKMVYEETHNDDSNE